MKKNSLIIIFIFLIIPLFSQNHKTPSLIPYPTEIHLNKGYFVLSKNTQIINEDKNLFEHEKALLKSILESATKDIKSESNQNNIIRIQYSTLVDNDEGYTLNILPEEISIGAKTSAGVFYAIQTIRQLMLLQSQTNDIVKLPALNIIDKPAFEWRGNMIDVSRHFFSIEYLKKHIDRLAFYKMNKLHLHLTDDQGWRIEIKKYPELTQQGALRTFNGQDSACIKKSEENIDFQIDPRYITTNNGKETYGGFFTQDEIKDLIAYAKERHIEIIPEIDMPGHMMAAINIYPDLTDSDYKGWGKLFSTPLCACKEEAYTFVENILSEIMELFPSKYIHIGADEVDKTTWENSELCKKLTERENIKTLNEIQSYFVHRVHDFVKSKNKIVIGWDEVLEGGINEDITIMYWRGWESNAPLKAVTNGNEVIMSPTNPLYFDYLPDRSSLRSVYNMNVVYDNIPPDKAYLIKGAQANLWTEMVPTESRSEFQMFPRITALAERVWTNKDLFEDYSNRLTDHYPIMDQMNIKYRLPDLTGFALESVYIGETEFDVKSPLKNMNIHYTTNGSIPSKNSPILTKPLKISEPSTLKFALFSPNSAKGDIYTVNYKKTTYAKPVKIDTKALQTGLTCDFFNQPVDKTTKIKGDPDKKFIVNNLLVPAEAKVPTFGLKFDGYINVPETGIYSFYFTCDDSGILYIADRLVVDNEGPHSPVEKSGQVTLEKGLHKFHLDFVEGGGGYTLYMQYSLNNGEVKDIPNSWFVH